MFRAVRTTVVGLDLSRIRYAAIPVLLFLGGLTADFTPLSVYLSLQVSDVLLIAAGGLALPRPGKLPRAVVGFFAANRGFLIVAALAALFLVGAGVSTVLALPRASAEKGDRHGQQSTSGPDARNGSVEIGRGELVGKEASISLTPPAGACAVRSIRVTPYGGSTGQGALATATPAAGGREYALSTRLRAPRRVRLRLRINWYRGAKYLSSSTSRLAGSGTFAGAVVRGAAPLRATHARPAFYTETATRESFELDGARLTRKADPAGRGGTGSGPRQAIETWLLFAMLFGALVPMTAVAVARHERGMVALALGLVCGAVGGAAGYLAKAVAAGGSFFCGQRPAGILGSDPLFLMMVGLAIILAHVMISIVHGSSAESLGRARLRWWLLGAGMAGGSVIVAALLVSRYRAAWVGVGFLFLLVVVLATRRPKAVLLTTGATTLVFLAVYAVGVLPDVLSERIEQTFDSSQPDVAARREAASQLIHAWSDRPWGIGFGESSQHVSAELVEGRNPAVHNIVLHALVEGGPLAALALAAMPFALTAIWRQHRSPRAPDDWKQVWTIAATWSVFVAALFSPTLYHHAAWAAIGALLGWAARRRAPEQAPRG